MLQKLLEYSRFLLVLPVIGSLLLTVSVVVTGLGTILVEEWSLVQQGELSARTAKQLTITVIQTIDMFLLGAISYIVAVGIYKLFISQQEGQLLKRIKIEKLADLENKIIGGRCLGDCRPLPVSQVFRNGRGMKFFRRMTQSPIDRRPNTSFDAQPSPMTLPRECLRQPFITAS